TTLDFLYNFTPAQDEIVPPAAAGIINVYPNPFNPSVTIQYQLPADCPDAGLTIYNVRGQLIRSYPFDPSTHESVGSRIFTINSITWDGRDNAGRRVGSGIYLVRLQGVGNNPPRKIMLLK
ncbi:MAG: T9SS type A sorting domain-containing protein, partial [Candidatus Cloacimonetes bacterium]|nr:T9SS type A sorting domain-containing protein [Candidatus Cloacimonadota bacterium]